MNQNKKRTKYSTFRYFPLHLDVKLALKSGDAAIVMGYLINQCEYRVREGESNDVSDWFPCPVDTMEYDIHDNADKQQRILNKLKRMNLIQVKRKGIPATRWVKINYAELHRLYDEAQAQLKKRFPEGRPSPDPKTRAIKRKQKRQ